MFKLFEVIWFPWPYWSTSWKATFESDKIVMTKKKKFVGKASIIRDFLYSIFLIISMLVLLLIQRRETLDLKLLISIY